MKISKFIALSPLEKKILLSALLLLAYYRLCLRFRSLHEIFSEVNSRINKSLMSTPAIIPPPLITQHISTAARYVPYASCLTKALTGKVLFSKYGYITQLHIGVSKDPLLGFEAHAWLTIEDNVVLCNVPDIARYRELPLGEFIDHSVKCR